MNGVLLINLGSPDSPAVPDVRRYLREFLMDGRVIDAPWPIRFGIVHFGILPKRPQQSAEAYHSIWTAEGSPLIVSSQKIREDLRRNVSVPVELAMRYQSPSVESAISKLLARGVTRMLVIPVFPHYAMSSYETAVERVKSEAERLAPEVRLEVQPPYYDHPDYIGALAESAAPFLGQEHDHLLFSFHGLPERHLKKADPTGHHCMKVQNCCLVPSPAHRTCYRAQCFRTVRAFTEKLDIKPGGYSVAFQSRLGREPWMQPYTDEELVRRARSGIKRLAVICPAFISDCLETLEEIGMRGKKTFLDAGGEELIPIPCLNNHPRWINALAGMVNEFCASAGADKSKKAA